MVHVLLSGSQHPMANEKKIPPPNIPLIKVVNLNSFCAQCIFQFCAELHRQARRPIAVCTKINYWNISGKALQDAKLQVRWIARSQVQASAIPTFRKRVSRSKDLETNSTTHMSQNDKISFLGSFSTGCFSDNTWQPPYTESDWLCGKVLCRIGYGLNCMQLASYLTWVHAYVWVRFVMMGDTSVSLLATRSSYVSKYLSAANRPVALIPEEADVTNPWTHWLLRLRTRPIWWWEIIIACLTSSPSPETTHWQSCSKPRLFT